MKSKKIFAAALLLAAVGVGFVYYKKSVVKKEVEDAKANEIAEAKNSGKPPLATPSIAAGEPVSSVVKSSIVAGDDVFTSTNTKEVVGTYDHLSSM